MLVGVVTPSAGSVHVLGCEIPRQAVRAAPAHRLHDAALLALRGPDGGREPRLRGRGLRLPRGGAAPAGGGGARRVRARPAARRSAPAPCPAAGSSAWRSPSPPSTPRRSCSSTSRPPASIRRERRDFWERIFELAGDGVTVLVSTHYMDEAVRCHRLAMLRRGRLVALGEPRQLCDRLEGRVVEIAAEPPERAVRLLRQRPEVASVAQLGDRLHVLLGRRRTAAGPARARRRPRRPAGRHASRLPAPAGLADVSAAPARPGLEDVFVAVTQCRPSRRRRAFATRASPHRPSPHDPPAGPEAAP